MVKILGLSFAWIPVLFAQNATVNIGEALTNANTVVNSRQYTDAHGSRFVQLQKIFLDNVKSRFESKAFIPDDLASSIQAISDWTPSDGNRVNNQHCDQGNCVLGFRLQQIWGYGCWCNFDEKMLEGRGRPQNKYDEICRNFQLCLRCVRLDGKQAGEVCDPATETYVTASGPDMEAACSVPNGGVDCPTYTCMCEQTLISDFMDIAFEWPPVTVWSPEFLHNADPQYNHAGWNQEENCPAPGGPNYSSACCGTYPMRFPYGSDNPHKACCQNQSIYNPIFMDCCTDGSVMDRGSC